MKQIVLLAFLCCACSYLFGQKKAFQDQHEKKAFKPTLTKSQYIIIGFGAHKNDAGGCDPDGGLCIGRSTIAVGLNENEALAKISARKKSNGSIQIDIKIDSNKLSKKTLSKIFVEGQFYVENKSFVPKEIIDEVLLRGKLIPFPKRIVILPARYDIIEGINHSNLDGNNLTITIPFADSNGKFRNKTILIPFKL